MNCAHPILPFQDNPSVALSFLLRQGAECTDFTEAIYRQQVNLVRSLPQGVLLQRKGTGEYLLAAESPAACTLLLTRLPEDGKKLIVHGEAGLQGALQRYPRESAVEKQLWYYPHREQPPFSTGFAVWPLDQGDVEETLAFDSAIPAAALCSRIEQRQVFGACIDDRLAGTVGTTAEGDIAWLTVAPEYRGQGVALGLLRWIIRRELENGHVPYLLQEPCHPCPEPLLTAAGLQLAGTLWELALP